jgi:hypothetical protein
MMSHLHMLDWSGVLVENVNEFLELMAVPRSNPLNVQLMKLVARIPHHETAHDGHHRSVFTA